MDIAKQSIMFPRDFKETVTVLHLDAAKSLQQAVDETSFFKHMLSQEERNRKSIMDFLLSQLMEYQNVRYRGFLNLHRDNLAYSQQLLELTMNNQLTDRQKYGRAIKVTAAWEEGVARLFNYPQEIVLEDGRILRITFDFFLFAVLRILSVKDNLFFVMEKYSIAYLTAHQYSGTTVINNLPDRLKAALLRLRGVYLPISAKQRKLRQKYEQQWEELLKKMTRLKSPHKRFPVIRELMTEWYTETDLLNNQIKKHE